jgi:transcriptional regulator with XRE-family HTH domain
MISPVETLAEYVTRVMKDKNLRAKDVQNRSGDKIDDAYVVKIMKGITTNPSITKTQALAAGLGIDEDEVFKVARGIPINENSSRGGDPWPSSLLIQAMERITSNLDLTRAVKTLLTMKPARLKAFLKQLDKE